MLPTHVLFWLLILGVGYTYVLYALLLYLFSKPKKARQATADYPKVLHIIAAFNEEEIIQRKINELDAKTVEFDQLLAKNRALTEANLEAKRTR